MVAEVEAILKNGDDEAVDEYAFDTEKYDPVMVVELPTIVRSAFGVDEPTPTFPPFVTTKLVPVVEPIANAGAAPLADVGLIESIAHGVDVPIPKNPAAVKVLVAVPPK